MQTSKSQTGRVDALFRSPFEMGFSRMDRGVSAPSPSLCTGHIEENLLYPTGYPGCIMPFYCTLSRLRCHAASQLPILHHFENVGGQIGDVSGFYEESVASVLDKF